MLIHMLRWVNCMQLHFPTEMCHSTPYRPIDGSGIAVWWLCADLRPLTWQWAQKGAVLVQVQQRSDLRAIERRNRQQTISTSP